MTSICILVHLLVLCLFVFIVLCAFLPAMLTACFPAPQWRCKYCLFSTKNSKSLLYHYRAKHFTHGRRTKLPCLFHDCPQRFSLMSQLSSHMNTCHSSTGKEREIFRCVLCDRKMSDIMLILKHLRYHIKMKQNVPCPFIRCSFHSSVLSTFNSHISKKHHPYDVSELNVEVVCAAESLSNDGAGEMNQPFGNIDVDCDSDCNANLDTWFTEENTLDENDVKVELAKLFLKMNVVLHVSQQAIQQILQDLCNVHVLSRGIIKTKIEHVLKSRDVNWNSTVLDEIVDCVVKEYPLYKNTSREILAPLSSAKLRHSFIKECVPLVEPVEHEFGYNCAGRRGTFVYVPILSVIQQHLKRQDIFDKVFESTSPTLDSFSSFTDGTLHKSHNHEDNHQIHITLYSDDWEPVNPLGTSRKKHKINGIYWTFSTLDYRHRSCLHVLSLACMAKSVDISDPSFGWSKYMEPLLRDLKLLEDCGVYIESLGCSVKGSITAVVADNLGAHTLGGFVESFGPNVQYICRFCTANNSQIQNADGNGMQVFRRRTKDAHDAHVKQVHDNPALPSVFGVKRECVIQKYLPSFSPANRFPPDIAHDLLEGVVPVELAMCLDILINNKEYGLSASVINHKIESFHYRFMDRVNKPQCISLNFAAAGTVGGNATENWTLIRLLPLLIGESVNKGDMAWDLLMDLKDIVELCFAPKISESAVGYLASKITDHKLLYKSLFPHTLLKPKHHFIEHYPELIREFGPLIHMWTMRFEAKHAYFKTVVRESRCFKNVLKMLANKHQLMSAYFLASPNYFSPHIEVEQSTTVSTSSLRSDIQHAIQCSCLSNNNEFMFASTASVYGTKYSVGMVVVTGAVSGLPEFSQILNIIVMSDKLYFVAEGRLSWFCDHIHGYIIETTGQVQIIELSSLLDYYPLVPYKYGKHTCVMLKHFISMF